MKKRRIIASLAILFLGAFLLILIFRGTQEPKYRGIKLSTYLAGFAHDGTGLSSEPPFGLIGTFQSSPERTLAWDERRSLAPMLFQHSCAGFRPKTRE